MAQVSKRAFSCLCLLVTFVLLVPTASSEVDSKSPTPSPAAVVADPNKNTDNNPPAERQGSLTNETHVPKPSAASGNCSANDTRCTEEGSNYFASIWTKVTENRDMLLRTMYVLFGVTGVVIIYFIVRAVRLRRKRTKSRKYGVITTRGDLEMEPLGQGDEDDEDYTVFEMNGRTK